MSKLYISASNDIILIGLIYARDLVWLVQQVCAIEEFAVYLACPLTEYFYISGKLIKCVVLTSSHFNLFLINEK